MDPGIENPKTRPDPNFHYPSPTRIFTTRSIPETRHATRGYPRVPAGTRHFLMIIIKILKSQEITLFVAFSAKWALFLAPKNFSQNFFSKKKGQQNFSRLKIVKFGRFLLLYYPTGTRDTQVYVPGGYLHYPSPTRTRQPTTRARSKPDFLLPPDPSLSSMGSFSPKKNCMVVS